MTSLSREQALETSKPSMSHALLHLDCSADLLSYSRTLGPGVQARCFERTSEALRAQLDSHRDFLLQHRRHSPIPRLAMPSPRPEITAPVSTLKFNSIARPPPPPFPTITLPQRHLASRDTGRPPNPDRGRVHTYPANLQTALERCHARDPHNADVLYEVVVHAVHTRGMSDDKQEVVGKYRMLRDANLRVAEVSLFDGHGEAAEFEVGEDATLKARCIMGRRGRMEIYVRRIQNR